MGIYAEYLDRKLTFQELTVERKRQLQRISQLRGGRDVLVYAADLGKGSSLRGNLMINFDDLSMISDQLQNLKGNRLDFILETPGGSGETAEDIIRIIRQKYSDVAIIIPGWAKSAGAIMAMGSNDILMDGNSALGPIDAQLFWQGKSFSADALLEGVEKIKDEVTKTGNLNRAYIPILQALSPGELQSAENALNFAKMLVTNWLAEYKFGPWTTHSSTGQPVTAAEKRERAEQVAKELCDHRKWLTHGRSIKMDDLVKMRLQITDFGKVPDLSDAIRRYYALLRITFSSNCYKVFETPVSHIYKFVSQDTNQVDPQKASVVVLEVICSACSHKVKVQVDLGTRQPRKSGCIPYPASNRIKCPNCGVENDLSDTRRQIEAQSKKPVIPV